MKTSRGLIALFLLAFAAPAPGAPQERAPAGATGDREPEARAHQAVHSQPEVEVPADIVTEGGKVLPAGTYRIVLMRAEFGGQNFRYSFEVFRPGEAEPAARIGDVEVRVMSARQAARFLGLSRRDRGLEENAEGDMDEPESDARGGEEEAAEEGERRGRNALFTAEADGALRIVYRTRDPATSSVRIYQAFAPLRAKGGR